MIRLRSSIKPKLALDDIFADDDLGLLNVSPLKAKASAVSSVISQFEPIYQFVEQHGRLPSSNASDFNEKVLARRFAALNANPSQMAELTQYEQYADIFSTSNVDQTNIEQIIDAPLVDKSELVTSLDDIFADDEEGLLNFDAPDIFTIRHVPTEKKVQPDERAQRQPCTEFPRFAPIFDKVQGEIKTGEAKFERFRHELGIKVGDCFILNGILGYVYSAGEKLEGYSTYNARLHLIFANGTELNMLYQSLTHGLVRDVEGCKVIREAEALVPSEMPKSKGLVYVLATKSDNSIIAPFKANLYKIGFTSGSVEERIKHAEKDKTFLEAPVRIVSTVECYNIDPHKLEALIHGFLGSQRLNISITSNDGNSYKPMEWFHAPLATVLEVIKYILDGTISQYRMDNTSGKIVRK